MSHTGAQQRWAPQAGTANTSRLAATAVMGSGLKKELNECFSGGHAFVFMACADRNTQIGGGPS